MFQYFSSLEVVPPRIEALVALLADGLSEKLLHCPSLLLHLHDLLFELVPLQWDAPLRKAVLRWRLRWS